MFLRTGSMWTSEFCCAETRVTARRNAAGSRMSKILPAGVDQFRIGPFQLLAVLRVHSFRTAARGLEGNSITLGEFRKKRVGAREQIRHRALRARDLIHHFTRV